MTVPARPLDEQKATLTRSLSPEQLDASRTTLAKMRAENEERHRHEVEQEQRRYREQKARDLTPPRFADVDLDGLDAAARGVADAWLAGFAVKQVGNLVLTGPVGVGKTHTALAIGRGAILQADRWKMPAVVFRPVSTLLDELRPDGGGEVRHYTNPDLLILDDLGTEKATEWVEERLYVIVNERWLACRPTIVTSNLAPGELDQALGTRTWDRLRDGAQAVALAGSSRRRPA